jgi:hypothetical protein
MPFEIAQLIYCISSLVFIVSMLSFLSSATTKLSFLMHLVQENNYFDARLLLVLPSYPMGKSSIICLCTADVPITCLSAMFF